MQVTVLVLELHITCEDLVIRSLATEFGLVDDAQVVFFGPLCGLFIGAEQTDYVVAPDLAQSLAHIIVGKQVGGVVELGDLGDVVAQGGGNSVVEGLAAQFNGIVPAYHNLVSGSAQVGGILLRGALAINVGQRHRLGEHVLGVTDVGVGRDVQAVLEESEVKTGIV